jgi:hypothetical protein
MFVINAVTATSTPVTIDNSVVTTLEVETTCVLNRMLEIYDKSKNTWVQFISTSLGATYPWITAWTDPTGTLTLLNPVYTSSSNGFTVSTADFATYDNENIGPTTW